MASPTPFPPALRLGGGGRGWYDCKLQKTKNANFSFHTLLCPSFSCVSSIRSGGRQVGSPVTERNSSTSALICSAARLRKPRKKVVKNNEGAFSNKLRKWFCVKVSVRKSTPRNRHQTLTQIMCSTIEKTNHMLTGIYSFMLHFSDPMVR